MQLSTYKIQKDGVYCLFENLSDDLIHMLANVRLHELNYVLIEIPTPSNHVRREIVSISLTPWGKSDLSHAPLQLTQLAHSQET